MAEIESPFYTGVERLAPGLPELKGLLPTHYAELSEHRSRGYELDPDYNAYIAAEASGQLLYVTLRERATCRLVGYFLGFVTRCLHYRALTLTMDIVYVLPEFRGDEGGKVLVGEVLREAKRRGIDPVKLGFKESHAKHMDLLLRSFGLVPFERTYITWLGAER